MTEPIIRVEHLSKLYRLGLRDREPQTLRGVVTAGITAPFKYLRQSLRPANEAESLWALNDISFDVAPGEVLGIVGRNGAGKSTLLKILSRITEPTDGQAVIGGRIGSLLEVGTGFHPELTGRENIFLSGAILGMKRQEIQRKLDDIVAFSEMERFLDTPVKRYSSGMYVRLAFSVAAHLEPEIFILDEVLAVGDAAFQQKCLDRLQKIRAAGHTILFVSHNMPSITRLCSRVLWIDKGQIRADGRAPNVVGDYLKALGHVGAEQVWEDPDHAPGDSVVRLRKARVRTKDGMTTEMVDIRYPVGIEIVYDVCQPGHILYPNFHFVAADGNVAFVVLDVRSEWRKAPRQVGRYTTTAWIPGNFLSEGHYSVDIGISAAVPTNTVHAYERQAVAFNVFDVMNGETARGDFIGPILGAVRPILEWETEYSDSPAELTPRVEASHN